MSIVAAAIAVNAVETAKLNDLAVTTAKLANGAVTTAKLANDSVTNAKIPANTLQGDRFETATLEFGTGVDLSKAGPFKAIYLDITFNAAANVEVTKTHDLNTTDILGVIPVSIQPVNAPTTSWADAGFQFHSDRAVDANTLGIKCAATTSSDNITATFLMLYR